MGQEGALESPNTGDRGHEGPIPVPTTPHCDGLPFVSTGCCLPQRANMSRRNRVC